MNKLFHDLFPDVAERESRSLHLRHSEEPGGIPAGDYLFVESYCTDPDCDCERVMLSVTERRRGIVATISYGFNPAKFRDILDETNPFLDVLNPQSAYAEEILAMFKELVLDEEYEERLKRHYRMVKAATGRPGDSASRVEAGVPRGRRDSARQRRKQQKALRRSNRQQ